MFRKIILEFFDEKITSILHPPYSGMILSQGMVLDGKFALRMDEKHPFSPSFEMSFRKITGKDYAWLRAEMMVFPIGPVDDNTASLVMTFQHNGENFAYRAKSISGKELGMIPGKWNRIQMDYLTPELRSGNDSIKVYFWLRDKNPVLIDIFK